MGQSQIAVSDIENFESAAGLNKKDPTLVMVPGTGASTVSQGDEMESDLDLEWSGAIAQGANIVFVYTGDSPNSNGVFDSMAYAIDENLAPILSLSYSTCEPELQQTEFSFMEAVLPQAAAQGQTVLAASGDQGATACFVENPPLQGDPPLSTQEELAVNYPASSAYVLGVGGTEISSNDIYGGSNYSTYWITNGSSDVISSLKSYIPEIAWNDDSSSCGTTDCLSASGGGASTLIARPSWQSGVTGIPSGSYRLVPDVALYSSPNYPGYLFCTSDTSAWSPGGVGVAAQQASCNSGFRDSSTSDLTVAGGTSFATPIFAGMVAILNQKLNYPTGQGLINPTLYTLAANSATYASAFHDITSGNNDCTAGSTYCSSSAGFSAGTGYDEVTGLGSVDLANLAAVWPAGSSALIGTATTVSASNTAPAIGANVTFTVTVTGNCVNCTPGGTVNLSIDGSGTSYGATGSSLIPVILASNGTATYTTSFSTAGPHEVVAQYAGNTTYATSAGSSLITIPVTSSGKGTFALAASPSTLTVSQGSQGTETVAATPSNSYTGTVVLSLDFGTSGDNALQNLCGGFGSTYTAQGSIAISGTSAGSTTLTLDTNASDCATAAAVARTGLRPLKVLMKGTKAAQNSGAPKGSVPVGLAFAGLALMGFLGRRSRKLRNLATVLVLAAAGLAISACGSSVSTTVSNPPKGTYTGTLTGVDSTTSTITNTTTFSFVID
jgi:subtilase family serine protease